MIYKDPQSTLEAQSFNPNKRDVSMDVTNSQLISDSENKSVPVPVAKPAEDHELLKSSAGLVGVLLLNVGLLAGGVWLAKKVWKD